jgi:hypothetical protein
MKTMDASTSTLIPDLETDFTSSCTLNNDQHQEDQPTTKPSNKLSTHEMDPPHSSQTSPKSYSNYSNSPSPKLRKLKTRRKFQNSADDDDDCTLVGRMSSIISSSSRNNSRVTFNMRKLPFLILSEASFALIVLTLSFPFLLLLSNVGGAGAQAGVFDGMCPVPECFCGLDWKGRLEVACTSGGLKEIPTSQMSPALEVIRIVAPKGRPNQLNIGRFFRQFRKLQELHIVRGQRFVPRVRSI